MQIQPDWDISEAILESGGTDAFRCFQCGKCMAVCPWSMVETVSFPVYRMPQSVKLGSILASEDAEAIEREVSEVYRCVGCESCTTRCPHEVSLPNVVRAIRRILVEYDSYPSELKDAAARIRSAGNPFGEAKEKRLDWTEGLEIAEFEATMDALFVPCCVPAYDPRAREVARATVKIFQAAGLSVGHPGGRETCCGESIRRVGAEEVFQEVAATNIAAFADMGAHKIVAASPHCYSTFAREYTELDAELDVVHQTQLFHTLIESGRLHPEKSLPAKVAYHDPCTLGRQCGVFDEPREVLKAIPDLQLVEIPVYNREFSMCCGGGGGGIWLERPKGERMSDIRVQQAVDAGAEILAVACPYCLQMFEDSAKTMGVEIQVKDVSEVLADAL